MNDHGVKPKSRQLEALCFSYFQYLYQQLRSKNEMGIAFQMKFVSLAESIDKNCFNACTQPIFVGEFLKHVFN